MRYSGVFSMVFLLRLYIWELDKIPWLNDETAILHDVGWKRHFMRHKTGGITVPIPVDMLQSFPTVMFSWHTILKYEHRYADQGDINHLAT